MNPNKLREELEFDEGVKYEVYLDHLGYPTFGIGHLIRGTDPESGKPEGFPVSKERVEEAFKQDLLMVESDVVRLFPSFYQLSEDVQHVLCNMVFNLGATRLGKFKNFRGAIADGDYKTAAAEMKDSRWYDHVTNRAERLRQRILEA